MAIAYVNIGSNLGDRQSNIRKAITSISEEFGTCCCSEIIETEAWGYTSPNRFLNIGVSFKTELSPQDLLRRLQCIEKNISSIAHRNNVGDYQDREIDIDIMAIDEILYRSDKLIIPHPKLLQRDFFLIPLMQLNPDWIYPQEM